MTASCVGTPISWTRLELYALGEVSEGDRLTIANHLDACDACRRCLGTIETDARPLRPLVLPTARRAGEPIADVRAGANVFWLRRAMAVSGALAFAAAMLIFLRQGRRVGEHAVEVPAEPRTKGTTVGFVLVRDDNVELGDAGGIYRDGERFKARVTCPSAMRASWDLVVLDQGEASFPLVPQADLVCGNGVDLPGAFRLVGHHPMTVCLIHREGGLVDRDEVHRHPDGVRDAICKALTPAP
jgi:hypothetical protein